jgi:hypothetical protein
MPKIREIQGPLSPEGPLSQASKIPETPEIGTPLTPKEVLIKANQARLQRIKDLVPTEKQRARLENSSYLGRKWLSLLPTTKNQLLADQDVTEAARNRLLLPIRSLLTPCNSCGNTVTIGHEDTCKGASRRWISRHNQITRALKNALSCRADLEVEEEPIVQGNLRADLAITLGNSRYFYDVQIVAINKESAKEDAYNTLAEAAVEKNRKYAVLGSFIKPLIFSSGGLLAPESAQTYKGLQALIGPTSAN